MSQVSRIAINLQYSTPTDSPKEDKGVEYLWGRIAFASTAFLAIVVLLSWMFYKHLTAESPASHQTATASLHTEHTTPTSSLALTEQDTLLTAPAENTAVTIQEELTAIPSIETEVPARDQIIFEEVTLDDVTLEELPIEEADEQIVFEEVAIEDDGEEIIFEEVPAEKSTDSVSRTNSAALAKVTLLAPSVVRAQLGPNVEKRSISEPLSAQLTIAPKQVLKVHFMTEYQGLKNQWIYHDWYLNNSRMARIKVRPQKNKMLAFSSKNIDSTMSGAWQVKVVNDSNILLAIGEFKVLTAQ